MKKVVALMMVLLTWLCVFSGTFPAKKAAQTPVIPAPAAAAKVAEPKVAAAMEITNARDARILHMLDLNHVYDDDFYDSEALTQSAAEALIDSAHREADGFMYIENELLEGFVFDLYGRSAETRAARSIAFPQKEGMTLIMPRGGADMDHTLISVDEEENGVLKVVSSVEIDPHDGEVYTALAVTRFAPCKASSFGWVIISAEIL